MKNSILTALSLAASLILAPYAFTAQQTGQTRQDQKAYGTTGEYNQSGQQRGMTTQQSQSVQQTTIFAQQLVTVEDLEGAQLHTHQGEELGSIDQLIFDTKEGKLAYVVVSTGGLWGIGERTAVIPWNALMLQSQQQTAVGGEAKQGDIVLVLNVEKEQLKNAPQGDLQTVLDRQQGIEIHQFYGVSPYWEGGQESQVQKNRPPGHESKEMRGHGESPGHQKDMHKQEPPGHLPKEERGR